MHYKKIFSLFLRISISIVLLVLLFRLNNIDINILLIDIKKADKLLLAIGFMIYMFTYIFCFLRWKMLLKPTGINISLKRLIVSFSGGTFFSIFLPSTIGGDVVRVADLAGHTKKAKEVIATVFLDRLSGYMGLVIVIILAFLFGASLIKDSIVFTSVFIIVLLLLVILVVLFNRFVYSLITKALAFSWMGRVGEVIRSLHREIHLFRNHKKLLAYNVLLSFIVQLIFPLSVYFIARSLGVDINPLYFFIFLPVIGAITLLPIAVGGLGLRESMFVVYFAKAGVSKQLALAMSLLSFSFVVIYAAVGGLIYVLAVHNRRVQHNEPSKIYPSNS